MNTRMPYYPPPVPPNPGFHNGFVGNRNNWNEVRPDAPPPPPPPVANMANWDRNRKTWKRNRNWHPREPQPYPLPQKKHPPRNVQNWYDNGNANYYEANGHASNWNPQHNKPKPQITSDEKDPKAASIPGTIANKKKRKPMSKSYPSNKWDEQDAEKALQAEKDFAKNLKNQSLIIRFPDPELTKDIVKGFHPSIDNVHFPQASTPRYCFAHLEDNADLNEVVSALEKIPFGQGYLSVDIKKAREENMNFSPKDIDPYTLYVGNLPMSVTKGGVIKHYPKCIRIDIGHPQQMKNTRYAFVRFNNVTDAIAAYRSTRNTQYESRSLIVRFRRINGNVGVPGESKQPNTAKTTKAEEQPKSVPATTSSSAANNSTVTTPAAVELSKIPPTSGSIPPDLSIVKQEPIDYPDEAYDIKPNIALNGLDMMIKKEIKSEPADPSYRDLYVHNNEDEVDNADEEDEYIHDNFHYVEDGEDDGDDYEDEDDYDTEDDDQGMELDASDTFLPGDDDEDIFNGKT